MGKKAYMVCKSLSLSSTLSPRPLPRPLVSKAAGRTVYCVMLPVWLARRAGATTCFLLRRTVLPALHCIRCIWPAWRPTLG